METTHYPLRAGLLAIVFSICLFNSIPPIFAQPTITVRFANPSYDCITEEYCVDVEFLSSIQDEELFGMNVRFFYPDTTLELISFSDFQGGYGPISPDPPEITTNGPAGPGLFNFLGPAEFVNGAIQLLDSTMPLPLDTVIWTKVFQVCFMVDDPGLDLQNFCPSLVWDLEEDPANGGFLASDDGVVITVVDPDSLDSSPAFENVLQFNWEYSGPGTPPFGMPVETECISVDCSLMLTCAADITIECDDSTDPEVTGFATATDICDGEPVITYSDSIVVGNCPENYTIIRTWIATNDCSVPDTCIQTISLIDTIAPVLTCPPDATIECDAFVNLMINGDFETMDFTGWTQINSGDGGIIINDGTFIPPSGDGPFPPCEGGSGAVTFQGGPGQHTLYQDITIPAGSVSATLRWVDRIRNHNSFYSDPNQEFRVEVWDPSDNSVLEELFSTDLGDPLLNDCLKRAADLTAYAGQTIRIAFTEQDDQFFFEVHLDAVEVLVSATTAGTGIATSTGDNCDSSVWITCADVVTPGSCPQAYTITRTWTASDNCGNSSTCVQTIEVEDTTPPNFDQACEQIYEFFTSQGSTCPDESDVSLVVGQIIGESEVWFVGNNPIPTLDSCLFDNCSNPDSITARVESIQIDSSTCDRLFIVELTIIDQCGNEKVDETFTYVIFVVDDVAPEITCPVDVTIECDASTDPMNTGTATATDDCQDVGITYTDVTTPGSCPQEMTITRTWVADDSCFNTSSCVQVITVVDTVPPTFDQACESILEFFTSMGSTCPDESDVSLVVGQIIGESEVWFVGNNPIPSLDSCLFDNCSNPDSITARVESIQIDSSTCDRLFIIELTIIDQCGNENVDETFTYVIFVVDDVAPEITCPADVTIECDDSTDPLNTGIATATDDCQDVVTVTSSDVITPGACPQEMIITRTWVADDNCFNSSSCVQIITVVDTTPPDLTCPANVTIECDEDTSTENTGTASATDNCDTAPIVSSSDVTLAGDCPQEYTITRTWTATDACGNSSTCVQTIDVVDTTPPVITCPEDVTLACTDPVPTDTATATDNCGEVTLSYSDIMCDNPVMGFNGIYDFSNWTILTPFGGSVTPMSDSEVELISPNAGGCPPGGASAMLQIVIPSTGQLVFDWNYLTVDVDGPSFDPFGYNLNGTFYQLTDNNGSDDQSGTTTVAVTAGDVFAFEQHATDCVLGAGATTVIEFFACIEEDAPICTQLIIRTHVAIDECDNQSSCVQTIYVVDSIAPSITCPVDVIIECGESTSPGNTGTASASDNCDTIPLITSSDVTLAGDCVHEFTILRTWIASDNCGNTSTCLQTIDIVDSTPPVIVCPEDLTLECTDAIPTDIATATDNCSDVSVSYSDILCDNPIMGFTGIYDFSNWSMIIPPQGGSVTPMGDSEVMLVSPNGGGCPGGASTLLEIVIPSTGQLVFDWNYLTVDIDGPGFDPFGYNLNGTFFQLTNSGGPDAQNGTTSVSVTAGDIFAFEQRATDCIFGSGATTVIEFFACIDQNDPVCNQLIIRTHSAVDECDNQSSCVQTLYIIDTVPPSLVCPPSLTIQCDESTLPSETGFATGSDNCDTTATPTYSDISLPGVCPLLYVINRIWTISDACGNSTTCSQVLTVVDDIPPVIICPEDTIIGIAESTDPINTGVASATDNCDAEPEVTYSDITLEDPCVDSYIIQRTWTATDHCDNTSTCIQIIIVTGDCEVDFSLVKDLNAGQINLQPGDDVDFTITVTNEGDFTAREIHIVDYIPVGLTLNDPEWTPGVEGSTGQSASIILSIINGALPAGGLLPGQSVSVEITLAIALNASPGIYENIAEISSVFDLFGNDISNLDIDSDPDTDDTNDPDAEDDHDPALICILSIPVLVGDLFVCPGDFVTYTVQNYDPDFTYIFTLVNGGGQVIGTTPSSITILWEEQPGGPFEIMVTQIASPECQSSSSIFVNVEIGDAVACIDQINISIDNECGTVILSGMILTGEQAGNNTFQVFIIDMNGDTIPNATLTWEHVGQTFKVSVVSECTGQSCWGWITVEDKLPPIIECVCPVNGEGEGNERCSITCLMLDQFLNGDIPEELRPYVVDNCGGTTLDIIDVNYSFGSCATGFIRLTWKATDIAGNMSTCVQEFDIVPISLASLQFPPDYEGECGGSSDPSVTGWPQVEGMDLMDDGPICNIFVSYWDRVLPLCGDGRKILRTWSIMDWCVGQMLQYVQTIKLADHTGPELTCPGNMQVGTDVWFCYANVIIPKPGATDACSDIHSYHLNSSAGLVVVNGNIFTIRELPIGTHTITWTVTDECYNSSTCSFMITVVDNVPPAVSCHSHTIVSLTDERPNGVTLVPAEAFNDGSIDNCGNVKFRARRMDSCIDFNWTTGGACVDDIPGGFPPVNGFDAGTILGACVPFACCDVGAGPVMVELEVTDENGNVNYCMVEAEVQDKIDPELICPEDIYVSCEFMIDVLEGTFRDADGNQDGTLDEDPLSEVFGNMYDAARHSPVERGHIIINDPDNPQLAQPYDWGLEGWAEDNCELDLTVIVEVIDDCSGAGFPAGAPEGAVKLIERRFIANDGVQSGSCFQRIWVIDFTPFFITDTTCFNENPLDGIIWPCDILITTCPDELENTGEPTIFEDNCSIIGVSYEDARYDFAENACYKILREWKILDWCQFDPNTGYGIWSYTQEIKVADSDGAEFLDAPTPPVAYCLDDPGISLPDNNQIFLGENHPDASSCSVHVDQGLQVRDACSQSVFYDLKIYLFNGPDFIQMVPETEVLLNNDHEAFITFNTQESLIPSISEEGLPYNSSSCDDQHRALWTVEDGCGNRSYADYLFRLEDCKPPTPVCIEGLSVMVMSPEGEVTVWANDFDASSIDDCTPGTELLFSFSGDTYQPSFTYTCDNVPAFGVELDVEIWVADAGVDHNCDGQVEWNERNKNFCVTTIVIDDINGVCDEEAGLLEGEILTEHTDAVSNVTVRLSHPGNQFPEFITAQDGKFRFTHVPMGEGYTIIPERNDDPKNGVSTLDLVHIQKHLLGLEVFESPYQYIAADANNSQSISAIDLIEIRKLILGIYDHFPANQSWRFVQEEHQLVVGNPWPFDEQIVMDYMQPEGGTGLNFVGVKIGDVNNTVKANATAIVPRSVDKTLNIKATCPAKTEVGEEIEVVLEIPEIVSGFQWTLSTTGLEFSGISSQDIVINDQNIGNHGHGLVTMSWNGDVSAKSKENGSMKITLRFKVTQPGRLFQMMDLNGKITAAEAYTSEGEIMNVNLTFNSSGVFTDFALFQNKPNPWNHHTVIGFHLPADASATLTVYDIDGKVVKTIAGHYKAGYNSISLSVDDIPSSGVLYYRLESGEYSASKKMVVID